MEDHEVNKTHATSNTCLFKAFPPWGRGGASACELRGPIAAARFCGNRDTNPDDLRTTLEEFMRFCDITQPPRIERGLFT